MVGYIYEIKNKVTNESYIGRHLHKDEPWGKYMGSGRLIKTAINTYGKESFDKTLLEECSTIEELMIREEYWLQKYKDEGKAEYNISLSGGVSSIGNYWPYLSDCESTYVSKKLSDSLKNSQKHRESIRIYQDRVKIKNEEERINSIEKNKDEVIACYRSGKSMKEIRGIVDIPQTLIRRILVENDEVEFDKNGHITRPRDDVTKGKISKSLIEYSLESGQTKYDYKKLNKQSVKKDIVKMYLEGASMRSIGLKYNVRGPRIKLILINEGITIK